MSGGSLDYFYARLNEHDRDFDDKELNELVSDLAKLFHDREWFLSGDTCEGDWNEARDSFKQKWFTEHGRQERIEKYLADLTEEVRRQFGMSVKFCKNCRHWTQETGEYGRCAFVKGCMMHRSENCEKWEGE